MLVAAPAPTAASLANSAFGSDLVMAGTWNLAPLRPSRAQTGALEARICFDSEELSETAWSGLVCDP